MTGHLVDTSVFIALETGRPLGDPPPGEAFVSVVTLAELELAVHRAPDTATRAARLRTLEWARSRTEPLPVDERVGSAYALILAQLSESDRRVGANDAWIAATAIANGIGVCTRDDDFDVIPGLAVFKM